MHEASERSERKRVLDMVGDAREIAFRVEAMLVMPERVRSLALHVDEAMRRIPVGDLGRPADGKHTPAQCILNERAAPYGIRTHALDAKVQPWGRDLLKVLGPREEVEHFVDRPWYPLFGAKQKGCHGKILGCIDVSLRST